MLTPNLLPLSKRLYQETKVLHEQLESRSFVLALRDQKLAEKDYIQHLADLKLVYETLEQGMRENKDIPPIKALFDEKLCRASALEKDLLSFHALDTKPTASALQYADHLRELAATKPILLLAHAYVRYLGDLSGGRMIKKSVEQLFPGQHTAFYDFDDLLGQNAIGAKFVEYKNKWKDHLDTQEFTDNDKVALENEAKMGFEFAGRLFSELEK